jgi:HEAT repeat protein
MLEREFGKLMALFSAGVLVCILLNREPTYHARSLSSWLKDVNNENPARRVAARTALQHMGAEVLPHILKRINSSDIDTRVRAILAVEALGAKAAGAAPSLILPFRDQRTSLFAARALAAIGPSAAPFLAKELQAPVLFARNNAVDALGLMHSDAKNAVPQLIVLLQHHDQHLRFLAVRALGRIALEPDLCVPALAASLNDERAEIREIAALSLARFGGNAMRSVPALQKALTDDSQRVQEATAFALREIGQDTLAKVDSHLSGH